MKHLSYFILLATAFMVTSAKGAITPTQAADAAMRFIKGAKGETPCGRFAKSAGHTLELNYRSANDEIYIFNTEEGFIIVSGEEGSHEILGYSEKGTFNYTTAPRQMRSWLDSYVNEIDNLRKRHLSAGTVTANEYGEYPQTVISPLLQKIAWDQNYPYNLMCPLYSGNNRAATGCAATAMAQIMYYHKYPDVGQGSHSYTPKMYPRIGELSVDFSQSHYDWASMQDTYSTIEGENSEAANIAVAKLMSDCGVAVSMDYGPMSGCISDDWANALVQYFNYSPSVTLRSRSYYDGKEWTRIIVDELTEGRPVYFTGFTNAGGHAFVLDGYDGAGFFHVNWGWSAMSNGYFRTTALTPATQGTGGSNGGFNSRQLIITGIRAPQSGDVPTVTLASEESLTMKSSFNIAEPQSVRLNGKITNIGWQAVDCSIALGLFRKGDKSPVRVMANGDTYHLGSKETTRNISFGNADFSGIDDGEYILAPVAAYTGSDNWERVRDFDLDYPNYLTLTVADGNAKTKAPLAAKLSAKDFEITGEIYAAQKSRCTATVTNEGDVEYYGALRATLYNADGKTKIENSEDFVIDLMPGESLEVEVTAIFNAPAGNYQIALTDENNRKVTALAPVSIIASGIGTPIAVEGPRFENSSDVDPDNMNVTAVLTAQNGIYSGLVYLYIYNHGTDEVAGCLLPTFTQAKEGENVTVTFTGPFENARPRAEYDAVLVDGENFVYIQPRATALTTFTIRDSSGIDAVEADNVLTIYNVDGTRIGTFSRVNDIDLAPGLYIMRRDGKTEKFIIK